MTSPAIVVRPQATLPEIAAVLSNNHVGAVPVCNPDNTLVGIVSEADLLKPFRESARLRRDWWLELLAEGEDLPREFLDYISQDAHTAADVMFRSVVTAEEQTTLPELAETMVKRGITVIPILRDGRVVGVVTRADLVATIAREPAMMR